MPIISIAQGIKGNTANIDDQRVIFISTATRTLQHSAQFVAGYELYYSGLAGTGLQNGFVGFSFPHRYLGSFGFYGQYFTSDIYRSGNFSIGYGYPFVNNQISVGLDLGIVFFSYNQDNFRLVDLNDPVFRDGTSTISFDLGLSVLVNPLDPLFFGIAVKHLNQPNMSLVGNDVRMPMKFQSGVLYKNSIVSPLINFEYFDEKFNIDFGVERWLFDRHAMLRVNYYRYNLGATAAFIIPLQNNWFRFEYEYRYPLSELSEVSSASHLFMVSYKFSRQHRDFELISTPRKQTIYAGESAKYKLNIVRIGGFDEPINLMITSSDSSISPSFIPQRLKIDRYSILTLKTSKQFKPGDYRINLLAQAAGKEKSLPVTLEIKSLPRLSADIVASVERLAIKEITTIRSRDPLLPYIFFGENKYSLNKGRYQLLNPDRKPLKNFIFVPEKLLDISAKYKNTLNVIARRLWDHPEMEIFIRGYNSNWGIEQGNIELSKRRTEAVRDYLVKNCGVRSEQIKVEAHHLPPDPASNLDPRGREENQRVEISCPVASQPILDPIVTETSEITTSDQICNFQIENFIAEAGLRKWKMTIVEDPSEPFKIFVGKKLPEGDIIWDWKNDAGQSVAVGKKYHYQLSLWDKFDQTYTTDWKEILVESISEIETEYVQKNIEKTRLILFKYDRADMELTSKSLQEELELNIQKLKDNLKAKLLIQGHTDIIGDPDYNMNLSLRRAETVAKYFMDRGILKSRITYEGFGSIRSLMSNNLPEGRMMNRRVEIYILY